MIGTWKMTLEDLEIFAMKLRPGDRVFLETIGRFNNPKGLEFIDWFCMATIGQEAQTDPECREWLIRFLSGGPGRLAAWQKAGAWIPPEFPLEPGIPPSLVDYVPE